MSNQRPDQPIDLRDFTREVARVSGKDAATFTGRGEGDNVDAPLLAVAQQDSGESIQDLIDTLPTELQAVVSEYEHQVATIEGLLERHPETNVPVCLTIEGHFAEIPSMREVAERLKADEETYRRKAREGFSHLLLVPFGMRLDMFEEAYNQTLSFAVKGAGGVEDGRGEIGRASCRERV